MHRSKLDEKSWRKSIPEKEQRPGRERGRERQKKREIEKEKRQ